MSGKITVGVLLLGAVGLLAFTLWFLRQSTPVDERFNLKRDSLTDDAAGPYVLISEAGDFTRQSFNPIPDGSGNDRHGSATYTDADSQPVHFEAQLVKDGTPRAQLEGLTLPTAATNSTTKAHFDAQTPFFYRTYQLSGTTYQEFAWINNNWLLRASMQAADPEPLLRFVDGYPF